MTRDELIKKLHNAADDPMWADHAEVGKKLLKTAAIMLAYSPQPAPTEQPTEATPPPAAISEDDLEAAYWNFDARKKGYGEFKGRPQSERDAYKWSLRGVQAARSPAPEVAPVPVEAMPDRIVAGVLFDFCGFLTSHETRWKFSAYDDASPAVEAIREFAERRNIASGDLDEAVVKWRAALSQGSDA